jgi:hypothetical protein
VPACVFGDTEKPSPKRIVAVRTMQPYNPLVAAMDILAACGENTFRIRARLQACRECCVLKAPSGAGAGNWTFTTGCYGSDEYSCRNYSRKDVFLLR